MPQRILLMLLKSVNITKIVCINKTRLKYLSSVDLLISYLSSVDLLISYLTELDSTLHLLIL